MQIISYVSIIKTQKNTGDIITEVYRINHTDNLNSIWK